MSSSAYALSMASETLSMASDVNCPFLFPTFCTDFALANGIPTYKMFNGHRGINHPVLNLKTGKGEITSQNHGFAVDKSAAESHQDVEISHLHLNDQTVAGLRMKNKNCFSVQYHPEAGPGPNDATYLFDEFYHIIKNHKTKKKKSI